MVELVPPGLHIDFLGKAKLCMALSLAVIVIGLSAIVWRGGLQPGIDFSGGTLIQLRFSQPADLGTVREALETVGWERAIVQHYGDAHEVFIRVAQGTNAGQDIGAQVQRALQARVPGQTIELLNMRMRKTVAPVALHHRFEGETARLASPATSGEGRVA